MKASGLSSSWNVFLHLNVKCDKWDKLWIWRRLLCCLTVANIPRRREKHVNIINIHFLPPPSFSFTWRQTEGEEMNLFVKHSWNSVENNKAKETKTETEYDDIWTIFGCFSGAWLKYKSTIHSHFIPFHPNLIQPTSQAFLLYNTNILYFISKTCSTHSQMVMFMENGSKNMSREKID